MYTVVDNQVSIPGFQYTDMLGSYNDADKTQEFLDDNGQPVQDCVLCLSLKDFICQEKQNLMKPFEDVQLNITSEMLAGFYKQAFATHVISEVEEMMNKTLKKASEALGKIAKVKETTQKQGLIGPGGQRNEQREDSSELKDLTSEVQRDIDEMKSDMEAMQEKLNTVDEKFLEEEEKVGKKNKVQGRISEVESNLAQWRAEMVEEQGKGFESQEAPTVELAEEGGRTEASKSGAPGLRPLEAPIRDLADGERDEAAGSRAPQRQRRGLRQSARLRLDSVRSLFP